MKSLRLSPHLLTWGLLAAISSHGMADLVALYRFEDSVTADVTGGSKAGTYNGRTFHGTDLGGTSLSANTPAALPGSTQSLSLSGSATGGVAIGAALGGLAPMLNSQNDWTVAMWMQTSATEGGRPLFSATWGNHLPNRDQIFFVRNHDGSDGTIANDTNQVTAVTHGSNYNDGNWHFVAVTHAGGVASYTQTVYVDDGAGGNFTSTSSTINTNWDATSDPNINVIIGNYIDNANIPSGFQGILDHFNGNLDDVAIFDHSLSEEELAAIRTGDFSAYGIPNTALTLAITHDEATGELTFTWDSQAGKRYDLLTSIDPESDGDPDTWTEVPGAQDLVVDTLSIARPADPTRLYVLREENIPPPEPATVFFDDFESVPDPDWTTGTNGGDAGTTVWERGAPLNVGPTSGYDDSATCFGTNISAFYTLNTDIWLRTPPIDLSTPGNTGATLSFWQHRDTDLNSQDDDAYGTIRVLDANSFAQLGDPIATGIEGFDDNGNGPIWVEFEAVPLPPEAIGEEVVIEFRFKTDNALQAFAGWYIDDVTVTTE